jgi:AcrR family transcriptional regulator
MPPKARYSKEQIVDVAFAMVRKYGEGILSARNIAAELGCSTAPIFTAFSSIEELRAAVFERAYATYEEYVHDAAIETPAFKSAGLKYIRFAKDEPELFKIIFMSTDDEDTDKHYFPWRYRGEREIREGLEESYGYETQRAMKIYNHMSVYSHGLATLYAQGNCVFSDEDVDEMLSEVFLALAKGEKL